MQNIFTLILLPLSLHRITANFNDVREQKKIASRLQRQSNLDEAPDESTITTFITQDDEKFDEIKLEKISGEKFKYKEKNNLNKVPEERNFKDNASNEELECVLCQGKGFSASDENCYMGRSKKSKKQKCAEAEQCYTELHPHYIRRGCILPSQINRTFVCKCPLCNDKPARDPTYYEYKTISDWEYDNERLQQLAVGMELLCKVCETSGRNLAADKICNMGKRCVNMLGIERCSQLLV